MANWQALLTQLPALLAGARGNGLAMQAFQQGFEQARQRRFAQKTAEQNMAAVAARIQAEHEDRQREEQERIDRTKQAQAAHTFKALELLQGVTDPEEYSAFQRALAAQSAALGASPEPILSAPFPESKRFAALADRAAKAIAAAEKTAEELRLTPEGRQTFEQSSLQNFPTRGESMSIAEARKRFGIGVITPAGDVLTSTPGDPKSEFERWFSQKHLPAINAERKAQGRPPLTIGEEAALEREQRVLWNKDPQLAQLTRENAELTGLLRQKALMAPPNEGPVIPIFTGEYDEAGNPIMTLGRRVPGLTYPSKPPAGQLEEAKGAKLLLDLAEETLRVGEAVKWKGIGPFAGRYGRLRAKVPFLGPGPVNEETLRNLLDQLVTESSFARGGKQLTPTERDMLAQFQARVESNPATAKIRLQTFIDTVRRRLSRLPGGLVGLPGEESPSGASGEPPPALAAPGGLTKPKVNPF